MSQRRTKEDRLTKTEQMVEVLREVHCNCHSPLREKLEELEFLHGKYSVHVRNATAQGD